MTSKKLKIQTLANIFVFATTFMFISIAEASSNSPAHICQKVKANNNCAQRWEEIQCLKPINGISNLDSVLNSGNIAFSISGGKSFTLSNRSGRIYAKTPMGNTDIILCKKGNSKLQAVAHTILGTKTVDVTHNSGRKFTIINSDSPSDRLEATVQ